MSSKKVATKNPIVDQVRSAREKLAGDYDYDLAKYCRALMKRQSRSKRRYVTPRSSISHHKLLNRSG